MAPRRTYSSNSSSPNLVVVVLMVLFMISTLALVIWIYLLFDERHQWDAKARAADAAAKAANKGRKWALYQADELKKMLTDPLPDRGRILTAQELKELTKTLEQAAEKAQKKPLSQEQREEIKNTLASHQKELDAELKDYKEWRDEWLDPNEPDLEKAVKSDGPFQDAAGVKRFLLWVKQAQKDLGWDKSRYAYATTYEKRYRDARAQLETAQSALAKLREANAVLAQEKRDLAKKYEEYHKTQVDKIEAGTEKAIKATKDALGDMTKVINNNSKLEKDQEDLTEKKRILEKKLQVAVTKIGDLEEKLQKATKPPEPDEKDDMDGKDGMGGKGGKNGKGGKRQSITQGVEPHALALDISKGKPLWDRPRGKIVKLNEQERRVFIDKGSADGVTKGLTFNVFGPSWDGRAEGALKGTIEVMSVQRRTAMARITSLYDAQGNEISLNDPSPEKIIREGSNAWKENDLIFNLAWGTRVVVAGVIDFNGQAAESPSAQHEDLQHFLRVVRSQGVIVDAYVDLRDGQLKGLLKSQTAYLVVGHPVLAGEGAAAVDRAKAINERMKALRKEAIERGMFLISADNFLNVVGYRRARSKTDTELSLFRPSMPAGGVSLSGVAGVEGGAGGTVAELAGNWSGKLAAGGQLRLSFKGDGGCLWRVVIGADPPLTGYTNVNRVGKDFVAVIQNRQVTLRLISAGTQIDVAGNGTQATLSKE